MKQGGQGPRSPSQWEAGTPPQNVISKGKWVNLGNYRQRTSPAEGAVVPGAEPALRERDLFSPACAFPKDVFLKEGTRAVAQLVCLLITLGCPQHFINQHGGHTCNPSTQEVKEIRSSRSSFATQ